MCATCGIIHRMNAIFSTLMTHLDGCRLRDLEEVAQISGVPFHTIAKIKRGETTNPRIDTVERLLNYFSRPRKKRKPQSPE